MTYSKIEIEPIIDVRSLDKIITIGNVPFDENYKMFILNKGPEDKIFNILKNEDFLYLKKDTKIPASNYIFNCKDNNEINLSLPAKYKQTLIYGKDRITLPELSYGKISISEKMITLDNKKEVIEIVTTPESANGEACIYKKDFRRYKCLKILSDVLGIQ